MVPVAELRARLAYVGKARRTRNVSFASTRVSPLTLTVIDLVISPGLNTTAPASAR